jgi:hypothetical protein
MLIKSSTRKIRRNEALNLPCYMELVGTLNYPTTMTKLEC